MAALMAALMVVGMASAALIGLEGQLDYPDIVFDNQGEIVYDADTNKFVLDADDLKIAYADDTFNWLSGNNYTTDFKITLWVDENGNLIKKGCMVEWVKEGSVSVEGKIYGPGTILLAGMVTSFGWGESGSELGDFDFLVNNLYGALVTDGIWPNDRPTGIVAHAEVLNGWSGSWECDFTLDKVKGNKAPVVPIPPTILLLGSGLLGFGLFSRRKKVNA